MPLLDPSAYRPLPWFRSRHLNTVFPTFFRRRLGVRYRRQRLELPDGDFVDIDWSRVGATRAAILWHGLVSNSGVSYMQGMTRALNRAGWDVAAVNMRGSSGAPNRLFTSYHGGFTQDLPPVLELALDGVGYAMVVLVGFSLGGNIVLKYLGEQGDRTPPGLVAAAAVSVPCDLAAGAAALTSPIGRLYAKRLLSRIRRRWFHKRHLAPADFDWEALGRARDFADYDEAVTAPVYGFSSARDYWDRCSCGPVLPGIRIPTLLINAVDDPFLAGGCYPEDVARGHRWLHFEMPTHGGHLGFVQHRRDRRYFHERRVVSFLNDFACEQA